MSLTREAEQRAVQALAAMREQPELARFVTAEVNAFFDRHPGIERSEFASAFITSIYVDHFSDPSGAQPAQPQKVA